MIAERKIRKIQRAGCVAVILASSLGALAIVRALGKKKIPCIVIGHDFHHKSFYTTVALKVKSKEEIVNLLLQIPRILKMKPVLFTDADEYMDIQFANWEQLENDYYIPLSKNNYKLVNKELIENIDGVHNVIALPLSFLSLGEIEKQHYPVIIKPLSQNATVSAVKTKPDKAYICKNLVEAEKTVRFLQNLNTPYVIQQLIEGGASKNYSALLYRNTNGRVEVGYIAKKLRAFPLGFGVSSAMISAKNNEIVDQSIAIMDLIDFQGIGEFEYKYCEKTNKYTLLEVNGRFPLQTGLLRRSNPEFMFSVFHDLLSNANSKEISDTSVSDIYWIFLLNDLRAIKAEYKASMLTVNLKACFTSRIQEALWSFSDPLPAIYFAKYVAKNLIRMRKNKHSSYRTKKVL